MSEHPNATLVRRLFDAFARYKELLPPAFEGRFHELIDNTPGRMTLASVLVGLVGIAVCAKAGVLKDRELSTEEKQQAVGEFFLHDVRREEEGGRRTGRAGFDRAQVLAANGS